MNRVFTWRISSGGPECLVRLQHLFIFDRSVNNNAGIICLGNLLSRHKLSPPAYGFYLLLRDEVGYLWYTGPYAGTDAHWTRFIRRDEMRSGQNLCTMLLYSWLNGRHFGMLQRISRRSRCVMYQWDDFAIRNDDSRKRGISGRNCVLLKCNNLWPDVVGYHVITSPSRIRYFDVLRLCFLSIMNEDILCCSSSHWTTRFFALLGQNLYVPSQSQYRALSVTP